jgi:exo-1,4-beta-D-glucosaminidase
MKKRSLLCGSLSIVFSLFLVIQTQGQPTPAPNASTPIATKLSLSDGWALQAHFKVDATGEVISTPKFLPRGWYGVSVPTTVSAALAKHKVYPDPDFGTNLRSWPGMTYKVGHNFSEEAMDRDSPFSMSWWYRKEFALPTSYKGKTIWLNFGGINYRANIFLNGKQIATSDDIAGAWRTYELNITDGALIGKNNVLAVQVYSPTETDLAITFVDWNPSPPDRNMGLWRGVDITTSGPVALRYPTVISKLNLPSNDKADLTVTALLKNATGQPVKGILKGKIESIEFSTEVELAANESKDVTFETGQFSQLSIANPKLWWPNQMGTPNLHDLHLEFVVDGKVSDGSDTKFGIREMHSELNADNRRVFSVNGKKILIRGGGWAPDMMLREKDQQRLGDELSYVQDMGLNTVRMEDHLENQRFFDMADRRGILIMAGWTCCSHWEHWAKWSPQDFVIAERSLRDQIYRLRGHPSLIMWLNGSDNPPPPDVEQTYLKVEKELMWPNPTVSSATGKTTSVTGESGVKMSGPYEYVAPRYWQEDIAAGQPGRKECNEGGCGGAYGFNTETSMGPAVPPVESIRAMVGKDHMWPIDETWNYHAGGGVFRDLHVFSNALDARYGKSDNVQEFSAKSQMQTYEGVRAMYEAYGRNKYTSTGVIQWMLNNAWPSMIWHLYDYYLRPGGGYFGAKKAMEALHPVYGYDDNSIWLVSSQYEDVKGLKLTAKVLNLDMTEKYSRQFPVDAAADSTNKIVALPQIDGLNPTYFLVLRLEDASGKLVGSNFYWLSTKQETLNWSESTWYTTPTTSYADFTGLAQLPKVKLKVTDHTERKGEESITHVTLENPGKSLAFFVRLKVDKGKGGEEILPVLWEDNYISLLPGEKREVSASYRTSQLGALKPVVEVSGTNLE